MGPAPLRALFAMFVALALVAVGCSDGEPAVVPLGNAEVTDRDDTALPEPTADADVDADADADAEADRGDDGEGEGDSGADDDGGGDGGFAIDLFAGRVLIDDDNASLELVEGFEEVDTDAAIADIEAYASQLDTVTADAVRRLLETTDLDGIDFALWAFDSTSDPIFVDNMNIIRRDSDASITIDLLRDALETNYAALGADPPVIAEIEVDGRPALEVFTKLPINGDRITTLQLIVLDPDVSYEMTYSLDPDAPLDRIDAARQSLRSLLFNN